jgi:hypothetical protein
LGPTLEELLLELGLGNFNLDSLVNLLRVSASVVGVVLDGGGEECVDEGRFPESRLPSNLWPKWSMPNVKELSIKRYCIP